MSSEVRHRVSLKTLMLIVTGACVLFGAVAFYLHGTVRHQTLVLDNGTTIAIDRSVRRFERGGMKFHLTVLDADGLILLPSADLGERSSSRLDLLRFRVASDRGAGRFLLYEPRGTLNISAFDLSHNELPALLLSDWAVAAVTFPKESPSRPSLSVDRKQLATIVGSMDLDQSHRSELLKQTQVVLLGPGTLRTEGVEQLGLLTELEQVGGEQVRIDNTVGQQLFALPQLTLCSFDLALWESMDQDMLERAQQQNPALQFFYWDIGEDRLVEFLPRAENP